MNIEQKMESVRKSLEKGARINIYFHGAEKIEEAEALINELGFEHYNEDRDGTYWVKAKTRDIEFQVTAFFEGEEEEPLPFTDEDFLTDADLEEVMKEDMRSEEYVSSFDLHKGEGL